jgi:hypothetical protein
MRLPPDYYVELGADLLTLRRHDGFTVATFSARGVAMKLVERAAWEDYEDSPPSPEGGRAKRRMRANFLAAFFEHLALVMAIRAGLKGFVGGVAPSAGHAL